MYSEMVPGLYWYCRWHSTLVSFRKWVQVIGSAG